MLGALSLALGQSLTVYAVGATPPAKQQRQRRKMPPCKYEKSYGAVGTALPKCLLADRLSAQCRNLSVFVALLINFGRGLFDLIGGFCFVLFIYGGFNMIVSGGSAEKG